MWNAIISCWEFLFRCREGDKIYLILWEDYKSEIHTDYMKLSVSNLNWLRQKDWVELLNFHLDAQKVRPNRYSNSKIKRIILICEEPKQIFFLLVD